ncbi:PASTA domain-containing protein [Solirubrobacter ginsenosidimutans]|uniref:PASTA domain-containing protein n=1 Tax=Solirubrobacter ginsenosidimutans TaxID=490573 RepID=A0A9X3N277_9ACTN|nr:PASTA domain-containing protein [Solirubrobacter ginsenosidimutans]MDA0165723.1 PASTA domain-containing protein [Solirubrobacter ginsenosidimutans]
MAIDDELLDVLSAPLGDLIASVGHGVADAQRALDSASMAALREIYGSDEDLFRELQAIGYRPVWYHIPEAEGDIQIALSVSGIETTTPSAEILPRRAKLKLYAAPVDASYTSRYNFSLTASSRLKFRVVPVPPSSAAEAIRVVPSLVGLQLGEARARLSLLGIATARTDAESTAVVKSQTPAPGTILGPEGTVEVTTA